MKIAKLNYQDKSKFNDLVLSHGTIFNTVKWTNIFENRISHYGIYDKGDNLIGGFITYKVSKFGFTFYRNPPCTPMIGPFLKINAKNPVKILDIWKKVLSLMTDFLDTLPYSVLSIALNRNVVDMQPFIWKKFKAIPGYTYVLDISLAKENIWKRFSDVRRNDINKGIKDGLQVTQITDLKIVRSLVLKSFFRQDKQVNEYIINRILFNFATSNNSFAFATYKNEIPIACSFCIYDKDTAYYLLGGYDHENKHHGAGALSVWESIKYVKEMGLQYFDFEGSMNQNIERYFRGFGGQLTPYYTINKAKLPIELLMKFFRRDLF